MTRKRPTGAALIWSCAAELVFAASAAHASPANPVTPAEIQWAGGKLRAYCQSCHGVGSLRFIRSDSNTELWRYLFNTRAPHSGNLWKDGIIEVLSWPNDAAPPVDQPMDPAHSRDWMPKGGKRVTFAADKDESGAVSRRVLLDLLRRGP